MGWIKSECPNCKSGDTDRKMLVPVGNVMIEISKCRSCGHEYESKRTGRR